MSLILLIATGACAAHAGSWTIYSIDVDPGSGLPSDITLTFENGHLTLNNELIGTPGGSSFQSWTLLTAGSWAAVGTIDGQSSFVADPYAVFVPEWHGGHIQWAANTPVGHIAPLQLGVGYSGDGAAHYEGYWIREGTNERIPNGHSVTGALVLDEYTYYPTEHAYTGVSHTFYATYVPELSSLVALVCGLAGLGGLIRRRKKD